MNSRRKQNLPAWWMDASVVFVIMKQSLSAFPSKWVNSSDDEENSWPFTTKEVDFELNWDRDWFVGVDGVSNGFRPSGMSQDWAMIRTFKRFDTMLGWIHEDRRLFAATDIRSRRAIFPDYNCRSSTQLVEGWVFSDLSLEANKIVFAGNSASYPISSSLVERHVRVASWRMKAFFLLQSFY